MTSDSLRARREAAGLTQAQLAARAGVSRQLVGAVEARRHVPRVDAALALASALGVAVESLFGAPVVAVDVLSGTPPGDAVVRAGRVGDRMVTAPVRIGVEGWDVADAVIEHGELRPFGRRGPGLVVAGCEPGLAVLEGLLREQSMAAIAATASSVTAVAALAAGRVHAAVVHGPEHEPFPNPDIEVARFRLARWRAGLAAPADAPGGWWTEALSGRVPVIQREAGAGVQRAFEHAVARSRKRVAGPRVANHVAAALRASFSGMPAVTIEPAALAVGAQFHPLEVHEAQIWVARGWLTERFVSVALELIAGRRFRRRLEGVGGYDLSGCGAAVGTA